MGWSRRDPIPPGERVRIRFDGRWIPGRSGEPVAISLWAAGQLVFGRSVKYHRPRGPVCFSGRCDGCLMRVDGRPSVPTCRVPARDGLSLASQNHLGSVGLDVLSLTDEVFASGLDHHHLMTESRLLNGMMQRVARRIAGVGRLPSPRGAAPIHPAAREEADVLVLGQGREACEAARAARGARATVRMVSREAPAAMPSGVRWTRGEALSIARDPVDTLPPARTTPGLRKRGLPVLVGDGAALDERLTLLTVGALVVDVPLVSTPTPVPGSDLPGVLGLEGMLRLLQHGVAPSGRVLVARRAGRPEASAAAALEASLVAELGTQLRSLGVDVVEANADDLALHGGGWRQGQASGRVSAATFQGRRFPVDAVALGGEVSADAAIAGQAGAEVPFEARLGGFRVRAGEVGEANRVGDLFVVGAGIVRAGRDAGFAARAGQAAARAAQGELRPRSVSSRPRLGPRDDVGPELDAPVASTRPSIPRGAKTFACRCEDVSLAELADALLAGQRDLESLKRYTGFATGLCQGKQCTAACARWLVDAGGSVPSAPITPRPPVRPVSLGALAGLLDEEEPR